MPVPSAPNRRDQIADAAWQVIRQVGLRRATLREIARGAGFTTGVIGHYFASRDELLGYAFERSVSRSSQSPQVDDLFDDDESASTAALVWIEALQGSAPQPSLAAAIAASRDQRCQRLRHAVAPTHENDDQANLTADAVAAIADGLAVHSLVYGGGGLEGRRDLLRRIAGLEF
jgi:AcrR family transcriptional regulator